MAAGNGDHFGDYSLWAVQFTTLVLIALPNFLLPFFKDCQEGTAGAVTVGKKEASTRVGGEKQSVVAQVHDSPERGEQPERVN